MLPAWPHVSLLVFSVFLRTQFAVAGLVNVTVDDTLGDPNTGARISYSSDGWHEGRNCSACASKPESSKVAQGTWTDCSFDGTRETDTQTATLDFTGTAVYVFCAIDVLSTMEVLFFIDGQASGSFARTPSNSSQRYMYNATVYANTTLQDGRHTLTIQNGRVGGGVVSILLDYVVYSRVDSSSPSTGSPSPTSHSPSPTSQSQQTSGSHSRTNNIIIGVCCAVGGVLLIGALWLYSRSVLRKKRKQQQQESELRRPEAFTEISSSQGIAGGGGSGAFSRSMKTLETTELSSSSPSPPAPASSISNILSPVPAYTEPPPSYS